MSGLENTQWQLAIDFHASNGTWDIVPYKPTMRVIGSMWKFKLKRDSNGNVSKFKARLVSRGDMQEPDWGSVFAPPVRYTSLRVILAIACHQDLEIGQRDVVTAFLNAEVESDIYMEQPHTGFRRSFTWWRSSRLSPTPGLLRNTRSSKVMERSSHILAHLLRLQTVLGRPRGLHYLLRVPLVHSGRIR